MAITRAQPRICLRLLDGWQLVRGDQIEAVARRERRLLSLLALRGAVLRTNAATLLWPDSTEVRALGNLRATLWQLQHHHPGLVQDVNGTLGLHEQVDVDVRRVQSILGRSSNAHSTAFIDHDPPIASVLHLLQYVELLPGIDEPWVEEERASLHRARLHALEHCARLLLARNDVEGALEAALSATKIDPYRETSHRELIRVHLRIGNHSDAVRVYDRFRSRLQSELGVSVSPQMESIMRGVRRTPWL